MFKILSLLKKAIDPISFKEHTKKSPFSTSVSAHKSMLSNSWPSMWTFMKWNLFKIESKSFFINSRHSYTTPYTWGAHLIEYGSWTLRLSISIRRYFSCQIKTKLLVGVFWCIFQWLLQTWFAHHGFFICVRWERMLGVCLKGRGNLMRRSFLLFTRIFKFLSPWWPKRWREDTGQPECFGGCEFW